MVNHTQKISSILQTYVDRGIQISYGRGMYLYDENDKPYLDLMSNYGVSIFGYQHPTLINMITNQYRQLPSLHGSFRNDVREKAAQLLVHHCKLPDCQVYWSSSGAEAIEAALKFAVLHTHKKRFIVCEHGYHGKTLGALSATSSDKYKNPFRPLLWEFVKIPYNDIDSLTQSINDQTAGFIVEPIQGEGGIFAPDKSYLKKVRDVCTKKQILLIIDEIQTGCGRTGSFLASQRYHINGDIICLGKGLAGGIPIGATIMNRTIALSIPKHVHTSTLGGNPLACAGIIATLHLLNRQRLHHIQKMGNYFQEQLRTLRSPIIVEVRGSGLMIGLVVTDKRNQLLKLIQDKYILVIPAGDNVIRFLPPFLITKKQIDHTIHTLQTIFQSL